MNYRTFGSTGKKVSVLGFGMMRLPLLKADDPSSINTKQAMRMVEEALAGGINYFDTAWPYHKGQSEIFLGEALKGKHDVFVADKAPVWEIESHEDFERTLDEQLRKLQRDHIDFYLLHALGQERWDNVKKIDLLEAVVKAKKAGKIGHIGFSFHDTKDVFLDILNHFAWDFCQVQMNYIDVDYQATLDGIHQAAAKGMGVVIMEPLRGGKLATPPERVLDVLGSEKNPVQWGLDFLWNMPEVSLLLSGMSHLDHVKDNLVYAGQSAVGKLGTKELETLKEARHIFQTMSKVACTRCEYCMPCPFGLDIPGIFDIYNATALESKEQMKTQYYDLQKQASDCTECGHCFPQCPQFIPIPEEMKRITDYFEKEA